VLAVPVASAARRWYHHWWWLPGWLFAALTQLPALLAIAWLVPGFAMLLAGRLTPMPVLIIFAPLAAALCYFTMRQIPVSWPQFPPGGEESSARPRVPARRRPDASAGAVIATVAVAAAFAVWQVVKISPQPIVSSDPGVYLQYGYWIATHGTARIPQAAAAFGSGGRLGLDFGSLGFFPNGTLVTPAFMPGLPLVLAAGTWLGGISGAGLMGPVVGGCAILSFAGLTGRLAGPRWAPVAALVLALTLPEQYASRTTLSEPLVQVLLFGGLSLILDSQVVIRRRHASRTVPGAGIVAPGAAMTLAAVGGLALGLTVLANIASLSILLPVFPVLAVMFVARRPQATPLTLGLFAGIGCGLAAGLVLERPYLSSLSSQLHLFGLCAAGFGAATVLVAPLGFLRVRTWIRRVLTGRLQVQVPGAAWSFPSLALVAQWLIFCVPVLALIGFAIRPYYQTVRGQTEPAAIRYVASLQQLTGVPVDGRRQYYEMSLDWVLWYLGVPAVLLACVGAALLGRRCVRAVAGWPDSLAAARLWGLPFLLIGWSVVTVLWDPSVLPDQPAASRRLVPVVLPGLVLLAVWACSRLKQRATDLGAGRVTASAVGVCCVLALAIPAFVTSFDPGVVRGRLVFHGTAAAATGAGETSTVSRLCSAIGPNASVLFVDSASANAFEPVVRGICGQPAASVSGGLAAIGPMVTSIEQANRRPVLLASSESRLSGFGAAPQMVADLRTQQDAHVLTGPPSGTWPVSYPLWMASPQGLGGTISG
jgi:hypothetical protein